MGLCNKPAISDYWSTYWLTGVGFEKIMTRNRFELLQTFLHFNDTANQVPKGQEGYNPYLKFNHCWIFAIHFMKKLTSQKSAYL